MDAPRVISKPYELIETSFESASADASAGVDGWLSKVKASFLAALDSDAKLAQIPVLTSSGLSEGRIAPDTLVRCMGMVQDVFDPEYYRAYQGAGKGVPGSKIIPLAFRDFYANANSSADHHAMCHDEDDGFDDGFDAEGLAERTTLCLVPLPGQAPWAAASYVGSGADRTPVDTTQYSAGAATGARKRRRDSMGDEDEVSPSAGAEAAPAGSAAAAGAAAAPSKRARAGETGSGDMADDVAGSSSSSSAAPPPLGSGTDTFPPMTLVRVYGPKCSFTVGEVVEFVGVYTMDLEQPATEPHECGAACSEHAASAGAGVAASAGGVLFNPEDGFMAAYAAAHDPDPFKVPRVHALLARPVPRTAPGLPVPAAAPPASAAAPPATEAFAFKPAGGEAPAAESAAASSSAPSGAPSLPDALSAAAVQELSSSGLTPDVAAGIRSALIRHFAGFMGGDSLAAEYLLTALVSHATGGTTAKAGRRVGDLTLHLSHWTLDGAPAPAPAPSGSAAGAAAAGTPAPLPPSAVPSFASPSVAALAAAVAHVWPRLTLLPLALPVINGTEFAPKRDASTERLSSALLRLAPGTLLLVDETPVVAGTVTEAGVKNLQALRRVAEDRELPYEFPFMPPVPFPVEFPVVFVTHGNRSVLDAAGTVKLPLAPPQQEGGQTPSAAAPAFIGPFPVDLVRRYLGCAAALSCSVSASNSDAFTDALLKWMKAQPGRCGFDELDAVATLARCLAVTYGERELSLRRLQEAIALDAARTARVAACAPPAADGPVIATPPPASPAMGM